MKDWNKHILYWWLKFSFKIGWVFVWIFFTNFHTQIIRNMKNECILLNSPMKSFVLMMLMVKFQSNLKPKNWWVWKHFIKSVSGVLMVGCFQWKDLASLCDRRDCERERENTYWQLGLKLKINRLTPFPDVCVAMMRSCLFICSTNEIVTEKGKPHTLLIVNCSERRMIDIVELKKLFLYPLHSNVCISSTVNTIQDNPNCS